MFKWMRDNLKLIMIAVVIIFIITCGVMYGIGGGRDSNGKNPNAAVVKINGKKVSRADVERVALKIAEMRARDSHIQITDEVMAECRQKAVDNMGLERELKKEIKARGIKVSSAEIKEQLKQMEANFPTKEEFKNYIERSGNTLNELKDDMEFQMQQQKLIESICREVKVTDEEIKKFYEDGKNTVFKRPAGYSILMGRFGNKAAADLAKKALDGGAKWDGIMKEQKAEEATKEEKPDFAPASQFAQAPLSAVKTVEVGKVTDVVELPNSGKYFIFKKIADEPERVMKLDEVKQQITEMIQDQRGKLEVLKLARKLKKQANIEIVDPEYFEVKKEEPAANTDQNAPAAKQ